MQVSLLTTLLWSGLALAVCLNHSVQKVEDEILPDKVKHHFRGAGYDSKAVVQHKKAGNEEEAQAAAEEHRKEAEASDAENVLGFVLESGFDVAEHFVKQTGWFSRRWHVMLNLVSDKHEFVYIDNMDKENAELVSTLSNAFSDAHWSQEELEMPYEGTGTGKGGRTPVVDMSPGDTRREGFNDEPTLKRQVGKEHLQSEDATEGVGKYFQFAFVMNPIEHIISAAKLYAEEFPSDFTHIEVLLEKQLTDCESTDKCDWVTPAFQPASWRLSSYVGGKRAKLGFVGKLENWEKDWEEVSLSLKGISSLDTSRRATLSSLKPKIVLPTPEASNSAEGDARFQISDDWLRRLCVSEIYGSEWDYFGYKKPKVCSIEEYISFR